MEKLTQSAKVAFASEFSFYLLAHNFHWNVEGPDFLQYHDLFGKIYEDTFSHIDEFAEKIRSIGSYVPASYGRFNMLSKIDDETNILSKEDMVKELYMNNEKMLTILKYTYDAAEEIGEHGFSNFLAERMDAHKKYGWMLRASMKQD